ncbi:MAG: urease accessory protein UreG [Acidimicrobiales bacterium]
MGHDHDHSIDPHHPTGERGGRPLRIGIGGPVGSGKTTLVGELCRALREDLDIVVVTNDIFTSEDAEALRRAGALPPERIVAVETGCCPHTAIRDDISANLDAVEDLEARFTPDVTFVESGGDNLTAIFSQGLVDHQIFVIDTAGGDDVPRKGGPGIATADLLVINKTDLAEMVGSDVDRMVADASARRDGRPVLTTALRGSDGATEVASWVLHRLDHWRTPAVAG